MADDNFNNWIDGVPITTRDANTRAFDFWYEGFPLVDEGLIDPVTETGGFTYDGETITATGTVLNPVSGAASIPLADMTITGAGTVLNPVSGTASFTYDAMTLTGAGISYTGGSANFTYDAMTITGAGTVINPVTGSGSFTYDDETISGTGIIRVNGSASFTYDGETVVGSGTILNPVTGAAAFTYDDMTVAGSGKVPDSFGPITFTYDPMTVQALGVVSVTGTANITYDDMVLNSDGGVVEDRTGSANISYAPMTITGAGTVISPVTGSADFIYSDMTMGVTGAEVVNPGGIVDWPSTLPAPLIGRKHRGMPENIVTRMESGRVRVRRQYTTRRELIEVKWSFTFDEFDLFETFVKGLLLNGQNGFAITTYEIEDDAHFITPILYELAFMGENQPYSWAGTDNGYLVSATVEVIDKVVDAPQENPGNPIPPDEKTPELEHTFDDFACQEMFHLKAKGLTPQKAHTIEIAENKNGPYRPHVYFVSKPSGEVDFTFNNDYLGKNWFRLIRDHDKKVVAKPTKPPKAFVDPPLVSISNTIGAAQGLWGDMAYNNQSATNQRINPNGYYIVPRGRVCYNSGPSLNPSGTARVVSITGFAGAVNKWTRDNRDPLEDTPDTELDGVANNCAPVRTDFGYAVRARSFVPAGCKSPITLTLVDKALWMRPWSTAQGSFADQTDTCDFNYTANIRINWERSGGAFAHGLDPVKFVSGDTCDNFPPGLRKGLIDATRGGPPAVSRDLVFERSTTEIEVFNRVFLGVGDSGEAYIGWDYDFVETGTFFASAITLERYAPLWDSLPPCFSYSFLGLGVASDSFFGDYKVNSGKRDEEVIAGPTGTQELIVNSWNLPEVGKSQGPVALFVNPLVGDDGDGHVRYNITIYLTLHNDYKAPEPFPDPPAVPPLPPLPPPPPVHFGDNFESYPSFDNVPSVVGLDKGTGFSAGHAWIITTIEVPHGGDSFESYAVGQTPADGLSVLVFGDGWTGAWFFSSPPNVLGKDSFETYSKITGMNAGNAWGDIWTIREPSSLYGSDNFSLENVGVITDSFHTMQHGVNWLIYWTISESAHLMGSENWEIYGVTSYSSGTLTFGTNWAASSAWTLTNILYGSDTFELYSTGTFTSGSSGVAWSGAWTIETI